MDTSTTNVEERDQWRARITRALSELNAHSTHLQSAMMQSDSEGETSADPDSTCNC